MKKNHHQDEPNCERNERSKKENHDSCGEKKYQSVINPIQPINHYILWCQYYEPIMNVIN